jgi:uncharacterized membrane protein
MSRTRAYIVSAVIMLGLDMVWLGLLSPPLYRSTIGPLMRSSPDLVAAGLFYAIYLVGVNEFVIRAAAPGTPLAKVAARGALFGLVAYATFDLTAQAVLAGWSPWIAAVDMAWGTLLTATVATATHAFAGRRTLAPR